MLTEPKNPIYDFSESKVIYMNFEGLNPLDETTKNILLSYNALIQQKP
jgi:hypothetical protein